jgi:hypothetical protein
MLMKRIGNFFVLMGIVLIGIYILSDINKTPTCSLFILGGIILGIGIGIMLRSPSPPPQETGRFRILRSSGKKQDKK